MLLCYFVTVEFKNEDLKVTRLEIVTLVNLLRPVFAVFSAPTVTKLQVFPPLRLYPEKSCLFATLHQLSSKTRF